MRTFTRQLRTRPTLRRAPHPATGLTEATPSPSAQNPAFAQSLPNPPTTLNPPTSEPEQLTQWRPFRAPSTPSPSHFTPPPPPRKAHEYLSPSRPYDTHSPPPAQQPAGGPPPHHFPPAPPAKHAHAYTTPTPTPDRRAPDFARPEEMAFDPADIIDSTSATTSSSSDAWDESAHPSPTPTPAPAAAAVRKPREPRLKLADIVPPGITRYAYRWETLAPSEEQLANADNVFLKYPPAHLWSAAKFKKIDFGDVPEVAFLGRSNVGKSSLLNALLNNKNLAFTSSKPGRTRLMNAFSIADGRLVLLDMPGYGHASREEWGVQIMKYLKSRKQFRRAFLLVDAKHGLKSNDVQLLEQFGEEGISFQIVLSKIDRVKPDEVARLFEEVRRLQETGIGGMNAGLGEILATSGAPARKGEKKVGMSELRWAVLVACGLENMALGGGVGSRSGRVGLEEQLEQSTEDYKGY